MVIFFFFKRERASAQAVWGVGGEALEHTAWRRAWSHDPESMTWAEVESLLNFSTSWPNHLSQPGAPNGDFLIPSSLLLLSFDTAKTKSFPFLLMYLFISEWIHGFFVFLWVINCYCFFVKPRCDLHRVKYLLYSPANFNKHKQLCSHWHNQVTKQFCHPQKCTHASLQLDPSRAPHTGSCIFLMMSSSIFEYLTLGNREIDVLGSSYAFPTPATQSLVLGIFRNHDLGVPGWLR